MMGIIALVIGLIAAVANILVINSTVFRRFLMILLTVAVLGSIGFLYKFGSTHPAGGPYGAEVQTSEPQDPGSQEGVKQGRGAEEIRKTDHRGASTGHATKDRDSSGQVEKALKSGDTMVEATGSLLYATGAQGEGVYAISTSPFARVGTVGTSLFNNAFLAVDRDRGRIYVSATNGGSVSVLSTSPLREIGTITGDVGWNTSSMALSPDGGALFLTCSTQAGPDAHDNQVVVLDTERRATRAKIRVGDPRSVSYLALSPSGRELFVSHNGSVDVYDVSTLTLLRQCQPGGSTGRIAVSRDGAFLLILQSGGLVRMRPDCSEVATASLAEIQGYEPLSASARKGLFWIGGKSKWLYSFDARDLMVRSVDLGFKPEAFTESANAQHVYVVTGDKNFMLDLDVQTGRVVQTLAGIKDAFGLALP
jgi:DNA-binding beta-propeller fold protein YncE